MLILVAGWLGFAWIAYFALTIYILDASVSMRTRQQQSSLSDLSTGSVDHPPALSASDFRYRSPCESSADTVNPMSGFELQISAYLRVWPDGAMNSVFSDCVGISGVYLEWFSADLAAGKVQQFGAQGAFETLLERGRRVRPDPFRVHAVSLLPLSELAVAEPDKIEWQIESTTAALEAAAIENGVATLCIKPETYKADHADFLQEFLARLTAIGARRSERQL